MGPGITPSEALKKYFGYDGFRPDQERIVEAILAGRDVLAVMPTGSGKSICYQIPALCLGGWTLVVSPLISLMADQVRALEQAGVGAAFMNSTLKPSERDVVRFGIRTGMYSLVYAAPEGLDSLAGLMAECPPALIAIDEAHCISQWGHDFRPSYTRIAGFVEALPTRPPVAAFTATATVAVREDIGTSLALDDPLVVVASFDRPNLGFSVVRVASSDKNDELLHICRLRADKAGIVYCMSRNAVEEVSAFLNERGISAVGYHAGMGAAARTRSQEDFVYDRVSVMVATNAFGMGIDKSNVGYVVHYNMPLDIESYYQEAGRAGRDGEPADCILLYSPSDVPLAEFLIQRGSGTGESVDPLLADELANRARERLKLMTFFATTTDCLRGFILKYFGETPPVHCGNCGNCKKTFEEVDATEEARKIISCVYRIRERGRSLGKATVVDVLHGSRNEKVLRMGLDTLSTYGLLADTSTKRIRDLMDTLIERGILGYSAGQYPTVEFTEASGRFLKDGESFVVKVPKEERRPTAAERLAVGQASGARRRRGQRVQAELGGAFDQDMYDELRDLRRKIADEEDTPAYIVFSNATLADMCRKMPRTREELLEVSGVGEAKAQRYGDRFLEAIERFLAEG